MSVYKKKIKPLVTTSTIDTVDIMLNYIFFAEEATVEVRLLDTEGDLVAFVQVLIPKNVYAKWTEDDAYLVDYVLKELDLESA